MTKLTAMRGIPGSGKSTKATEIAKDTGAVIVNRDYLRKMLLGEWYTGNKVDEERVTIAEEAQVTAFIKSGVDVIIDATHLEPRYLKRWARMATRYGCDFEVVDVIEDVTECQRRVYDRWQNSMGTASARYIDPQVIDKMVKRHPPETWPTITAEKVEIEPYVAADDMPWAVLCDLDGTAAHMVDRDPYDYRRVHEDIPDDTVRTVLNRLAYDHIVIYCSGRPNTCRDATSEWLHKYNFPVSHLLMRDPEIDKDAHGNQKPDYQVKLRLFNEHIRGNYDVRAVFDDRLQVCEVWHKLGLSLFRCGDPNANF